MKFRGHFSTTLCVCLIKINFKLAIREMYPRILREPVADPSTLWEPLV